MAETESPEAIKYHLQYLRLLQQQTESFNELMTRFDKGDSKILEFLNKASGIAAARNPRFVLEPELVTSLRKENPSLYAKIEPIYTTFLKEKAGLL